MNKLQVYALKSELFMKKACRDELVVYCVIFQKVFNDEVQCNVLIVVRLHRQQHRTLQR